VKSYLSLFGALLLSIATSAQSVTSLIPVPVSEIRQSGTFTLDHQTVIQVSAGSKECKDVAMLLSELLVAPTGMRLPVTASTGKGTVIAFRLSPVADKVLGKEGYTLEVNPRQVIIKANEPAGLFYGMQTLLQLLPPEIAGSQKTMLQWRMPCVKILDYPRFGWRGLMLDVSRHFFPKEVVKQYIDQMSKYKLNVFHWHLTDDQGWRIEIKSLPELTSVGAWRVPRTGQWWSFLPPQPGEKSTYGGYYTQNDIKEIIQYAAERYVTILPEIDVPGHSLAMLAAYPELSSTGLHYQPNPGSKFYGIEDNALCPGNEKVYTILDKVFTEVAALFPHPYIHIGGDECYKGFWKKCEKCQRCMKENNLQNEEELQSYFIKRIEKILHAKGKKMIGWDEILEGGLAPDATVMSWRGMEGGIKAAKMDHQVIMTPTQHCYLDLYQGDPVLEPDTYSMLRLQDCYSFEPVPAGVKPEMILGGQGNLWAESVYNQRHAEYMTWPRSLALAEVLWSPKEKQNWNGFVERMEAHFLRLDAAGVNYAKSVYTPAVHMEEQAGKKVIKIAIPTAETAVYYSFDNGNPDKYYPQYTQPLTLPEGAYEIRMVTYRKGKRVGEQLNLRIKELENRMKKG
jgi:hexosaminidase